MYDPGPEGAVVWKVEMFGGATPATPLVLKKTVGTTWRDTYTDQFKVALRSAAGHLAMSKRAHG